MMNNRNMRMQRPYGLGYGNNCQTSMCHQGLGRSTSDLRNLRGNSYGGYKNNQMERSGVSGRTMPLNNSHVRGQSCGCGRTAQPRDDYAARRRDIPMNNNGCGCGCNGEREGDTECQKLLKQIQTVDFALCEIILFLDAYPDHCEALELYHKLMTRRQGLITTYENSCGPMTAMGNVSTTSWDWVKAQAPWEYPAD